MSFQNCMPFYDIWWYVKELFLSIQRKTISSKYIEFLFSYKELINFLIILFQEPSELLHCKKKKEKVHDPF